MPLANRVHWYLDHHHIDYQVVHHDPAKTSLEAGLRAHVPPGKVAKCVLLEDESLLRMPDVYFEGGDHEDLVHVQGEAFRELMRRARHGKIGRPN